MLIGAPLSLAYFLIPRTAVAIVVGLIAVDLLGTSLMGWSPLYFALRRSTRTDKDVKPLPGG